MKNESVGGGERLWYSSTSMSTRLAQIISHLFDPIPTTLVIGLIGIFATPMSPTERLFWLVLVGVMGVLVGLMLWWFIRQGYVIDAKLTHGQDFHRDRLGVLWIAVGLLVIADLIAWQMGQAEPLWSMLVSLTVLLTVATLITQFYKISLHMIGTASLVTILILQFHSAALLTLLLLPLVAWSRRVLHRHTPAQLLLGTGLAVAIVTTTFALTGQL